MDEETNDQENGTVFSEEQRLVLHQMRLLEWLDNSQKKELQKAVVLAEEEADEEDATVPKRWKLTEGVSLYDWQKECIEAWFQNEYRGTVKVVTGGGKTLLGLAIAERLQQEVNPRLRIAIVVPTVVLMHQWYDEILQHSNLPAHVIGRLGGGYKEDFKDGRRILITVLASARKQLAKLTRSGRNGQRLFLIADECHRTGATLMSEIFETERAFSLGLSATPERDDDTTDEKVAYDTSLLGQELGSIIYDFNLAKALEVGVIPPFSIQHYGLPLNIQEQVRYDQISRSISDTQSEVRQLAPQGKRTGTAFFKWLHSVAGKGGEQGHLAARLVSSIARRKELLQNVQARGDAIEALLRQEFTQNPDARAILFHESIDSVMELYHRLHKAGFSVIAEHSRLPDSLREEGLELFRKGIAQVIVSAKSLIEGFNVPAVDVGIVAASTSSVRQRIQSLGRVLRRHRTASGEEKTSAMHILYAKGTTDEQIYAKLDWDQATGVEQNLYYLWDIESEPVQQEGPPKSPLPTEESIDEQLLEVGCEYPGAYEGPEYSCDTQGNIVDAEGAFAKNVGDLPQLIMQVRGSAGRFRISPMKNYVLVKTVQEDEWITLFVTRLKEPLDFQAQAEEESLDVEQLGAWLKSAKPGDKYPFDQIPLNKETIVFKNKRGGVLCKKIKDGEKFARTLQSANDPESGRDAERIINAIRVLHGSGQQVSKLIINDSGHVLYRSGGQLFFIANLDKGLEFPE